jgi:hypothetical protein
MKIFRNFLAVVALACAAASAQIVNPSQPATGVPLAGTGISVAGQTVSLNYAIPSSTYTGNITAAVLTGSTSISTPTITVSGTTNTATLSTSGLATLASETVSGTTTNSGPTILSGAVSGAGIAAYEASLNHVQTVVNVAALRALSCVSGLIYQTQGYYTQSDGAGAQYMCNGSDTTTPDNGGTFIAAANTSRYYLQYQGQLNAKYFGAKCDNSTNDATSLTNLFATNLPWYIPSGNCVSNTALAINADGSADGNLVAATGFSGNFVTICNSTYGIKRKIYGLSVYSTDVRPNPYTAAKSVGIYVGPNATFINNTPTPGVTLYSARATRFSIGVQISTFNVSLIGGLFPQNDHNILVYATDTSFNQINDVSLIDVQSDSAASSFGQAYGLRVGTIGNAVYTGNSNQGVNLQVQGCNFDGAPVFVDNMLGFKYFHNYHEQGGGYTYHGGALVLGSAGASFLQTASIDNNWFTQFDYAIVLQASVNALTIGPNTYATIKYAGLQSNATETQSFNYTRGIAAGSTNFGGGNSEVQTNYSGGVSLSQLTFGGLTLTQDFLNNGVQLANATNSTTNWYPMGQTLDGNINQSSAFGRFRSGAAVQTGIAGTQSGVNFTFTTLAQATLFNGGDRISSGSGGSTFIKSINYNTGIAVLDGSFSGGNTISHTGAYFVGFNLFGTGSPAGVVVANPGSRYTNTTGGTGTTTYVKETLTTSAGWVAK